MKKASEIRTEFINFFKEKGHTFVPSWPVIPMNDPTLLFTNAGMNQFKDIFLEKAPITYKSAVNSQRCIRVSGKHNDLEEVGHDTYHHTFFEMLGNWSFGDYYKEEAIKWAWELLTEVWKLPKDKLYATVFREDDEAAELWPIVTDISPDRVLRFDEKDNFWEMADTGPCGPCSEIHIDLGEPFCDKKDLAGHVCGVNGECGRFIELWNLVFIQYHKDEQGNLNTLPKKHVDTGMGFERIVSVLQGVYDNYKTDLFTPIISEIANLSGVDYHSVKDKSPFHVIADHIRMLTFSIGDGGLPSNEGRGYVIRRILRRAARYGRKLNLHEPFIYKLVPVVIEVLGDAFPEIKEKESFARKVIKSEEENFNKTLDKGIEIFGQIVKKMKKEGKIIISGEDAFKLYDTYGFPLDLTKVMAEEEQLSVDEEGFDREMEKQRERARQAGKFVMSYDHEDNWNIIHHGNHSRFVGYETMRNTTRLMKFLEKENELWIILEETPFYPEGGGQIGDKGILKVDSLELKVMNTIKDGEHITHICEKPDQFSIVHGEVIAEVFEGRRQQTMYNHTATHLLHAALRKVLGTHVQQSGSLVEPDRLRFDFTHFEKITNDQIDEIEKMVNEHIRADYEVEVVYTTLDKAKEMGAMALFGEKYGDEVRVITIDGVSKELCGGTHVSRTGQIGLFRIVMEESVAAGVRRIEAVTGPVAVQLMQEEKKQVGRISKLLNVPIENLDQKIEQLLEEKRELEKKLKDVAKKSILSSADDYLEAGELVGEIRLVYQEFEDVEINLLKELADILRSKEKQLIAVLINKSGGKVNFVVVVSEEVIKTKGLKAGVLAKEIAGLLGGGGGGRPDMATAGGTKVENLPKVKPYVIEILKK
ncbi:MAG: alanine--tRNA ligase [Calditrichia bacterium]